MEFSYTFLENFIWADAWVLIPVLYLIGMLLEKTPKVPEWVSNWILMILGVVFCLLNYGWIVQAVVQGILTSGGAVLLRDLVQKPIQSAKKNPTQNKQDDSNLNDKENRSI